MKIEGLHVISQTVSRVVWDCPKCGLKRHHTVRSGAFPQAHACSHCPWNCRFDIYPVMGRLSVWMTRYEGKEL